MTDVIHDSDGIRIGDDSTVGDGTVSGGAEAGGAITVVAGNPTATELAAVTAVLSAMADEVAGRRLLVRPSSNAWQRSRGTRRAPLYPGLGAWREFSGQW